MHIISVMGDSGTGICHPSARDRGGHPACHRADDHSRWTLAQCQVGPSDPCRWEWAGTGSRPDREFEKWCSSGVVAGVVADDFFRQLDDGNFRKGELGEMVVIFGMCSAMG